MEGLEPRLTGKGRTKPGGVIYVPQYGHSSSAWEIGLVWSSCRSRARAAGARWQSMQVDAGIGRATFSSAPCGPHATRPRSWGGIARFTSRRFGLATGTRGRITTTFSSGCLSPFWPGSTRRARYLETWCSSTSPALRLEAARSPPTLLEQAHPHARIHRRRR